MTDANGSTCPRCSHQVIGRRCEKCGLALAAGSFVIERLLSESGQSRTYLAHDASGAQVFLKELLFLLAPDVSVIQAFERESETLKQLRHPRIPEYLAHFSEGEGIHFRLYLAERYIEGESLLDELGKRRYSEAELREIAAEMLDVLRYLQERTPPIVHRDLKPANIIRAKDQKLALVDFGSARDAAGSTQGGTMTGTLGYAPAEQLAGVVSPGSDVYALAATLMHLLSHKAPWEQVAAGVEPRPRTLGVSASFASWLTQALDLRPAKRFASAAEAKAALAHKSVAWSRLVPGAVGLLLLGGVGVFAAHPNLRPPPPVVRVHPADVDEFCPEGAFLGGDSALTLPPSTTLTIAEQFCQTRVGERIIRNGVSAQFEIRPSSRRIARLAHYKDDMLDGEFVKFGFEGEKEEAGRYVGGLRQGPWRLGPGQGGMVDGKKQGVWIWYDSSWRTGVVRRRAAFVNDQQDGPSTTFDEQGGTFLESAYKGGKLEGLATQYFPDGKVSLLTTYANGARQGAFTEFYPDGTKKTTGSFVENLSDGLWTAYFRDGSVSSITRYQAMRPIEFRRFWENGAKREEWRLLGSWAVGTRTTFDEAGIKLSEDRSCDDDPTARRGAFCRVDYFPSGKVKRRCGEGASTAGTVDPIQDRFEGPCREWFEDGALKSEGQYASSGNLDGSWKYYWPNKKLMRIEEYTDGKLNGEQRQFFENGRLQLSGTWERGQKKQIWIERSADGQQISKHDYGR